MLQTDKFKQTYGLSGLHQDINIAGSGHFPPGPGAKKTRPFDPIAVRNKPDNVFKMLKLVNSCFSLLSQDLGVSCPATC